MADRIEQLIEGKTSLFTFDDPIEKTVDSLSLHISETVRKPMVVIDAGIASDENLIYGKLHE